MATPSLLFAPPGAPSTPMGPQLALPAVAGGKAQSFFPNALGALPAPAKTVLKKDPSTGMFSAAPDAPVGAPVDNTDPAQTAPQESAYDLFLKNITAMLTKAQGVNTDAQNKLGGARDFLKTESVNGGAPKPFDPTVFSDAQIGNQEKLQAGFDPAITSINTQMENENRSMENITNIADKMASYYKPEVLSPGQSLVQPDGKIIRSGHVYTPTLNSLTGLMDGFDETSGTWASDESKNGMQTGGGVTTPQTLLTAGIVAGIDLSGASVGMKPYATDPNYVQEVNGLYSQIVSSQPLPTSQGLDAIIKGMAKSSPITGQMIMNAAATYKLDPNLLAAVLGHESDFGTQGVATSTMNPGNVGNTGSSTQNFGSWTQGVNGAAAALAKRIVGPNTPAPVSTESKVGGQFSPTATQRVSQLPASMQSFVDAGPQGVAYINDDRVPAELKTAVKTLASRAGIPYVESADAQAIKSIGVVYQSLDKMQELVNTNLNSGILGRGFDIAKAKWNDIFQNNADLTKFNSYRDTAIKAVQALAGGAGSGLRINGAEIEANVGNLPGPGDNIETGTARISQLKTFLNQQLGATFPYIGEGATSAAKPPAAGGTIRVQLANGQTGSINPSEYDPATMKKL